MALRLSITAHQFMLNVEGAGIVYVVYVVYVVYAVYAVYARAWTRVTRVRPHPPGVHHGPACWALDVALHNTATWLPGSFDASPFCGEPQLAFTGKEVHGA